MLRLPVSSEEVPDLDQLPCPSRGSGIYVDVIADILQVAAWQGFDLDEILEEATQCSVGTFNYSADAAAGRPTTND